ncbi:two-component system, chemotaxis family, response regulator CheB [Candidatus Electrothrix aarhusensis]|uniref:protein-glutamate methylesterase n=1 Tax=Candidatus Electrothrix aarhusensis TaxID=1859131 RepID=A0A444IYH2_9BACT|nr:two-component system, chemotaxis family, response regulator CheB [Candidatus Electrothrix aarhusensis]
MKYRAIVVGASAGGVEAFVHIFSKLPALFSLPIIFVQHLHKDQENTLAQFYNDRALLKVEEAEEKERILPGHIYIAPPDYHLLIERDETFSLSVDEKVNYSRPSIDVLFESAAEVYGAELVGVLLTGANHDGSCGLQKIKEHGGLTLVEDPTTAKFPEMPRSALACTDVDYILPLEELGEFLLTLADGCLGKQEKSPVQ